MYDIHSRKIEYLRASTSLSRSEKSLMRDKSPVVNADKASCTILHTISFIWGMLTIFLICGPGYISFVTLAISLPYLPILFRSVIIFKQQAIVRISIAIG